MDCPAGNLDHQDIRRASLLVVEDLLNVELNPGDLYGNSLTTIQPLGTPK